jgi:hypothetical protein
MISTDYNFPISEVVEIILVSMLRWLCCCCCSAALLLLLLLSSLDCVLHHLWTSPLASEGSILQFNSSTCTPEHD